MINATMEGRTVGTTDFTPSTDAPLVDADSILTQTHVITAPVLFVDRAAGNYHLAAPSPAIDAADPAGIPPAPPIDLDEAPRPYGPRVDIGAFEWVGPLNYLPIVRKEACVFPALAGWALAEHGANSGSSVLYTTDGGATWGEPLETCVRSDVPAHLWPER